MEKDFIPYEQALALKELGFDELCFGFYNIRGFFVPDYKVTKLQIDNLKLEECCLAPTFSQAFRWFREKYNLHYKIEPTIKNKYVSYVSKIGWEFVDMVNTYEKAEPECLKKLIEIVKEQK